MLNKNTASRPPDQFSLKQRVFSAGAWSLAGFGVSQIIRLGSSLVLTRLLLPEMFGVMAMATMVMVGLTMFSDVGLKQNVIQSKRGNDPAFLNTAWITQILRGVVLWFFALCAAMLLWFAARTGMVPKSSAYADPSLPYVVGILSVSVVISGFQSTKVFEASRNLSLGAITKNEIIGQMAGLLCTIGWALIDRSIWALVAGNICSAFISTLLSHVRLAGITNRWEWDKSAFKEIIHFGKWMFLSSIIGFLVINGDRLILGGLINSTMLGIYVIAYSIFSSAETILGRIIGEVSFPALSEIVREYPQTLRTNYYRFHAIIASFAYICSGFLMTSGELLIRLLYDRRYEQAGWMLEVLAAGLLTVPFRTAIQCFVALGMPKLMSYTGLIRLVAIFFITPIGFHLFDLKGALVAIVFSNFSWLPTTIYYKVKFGLFDLRKELLLLACLVIGVVAGNMLNRVIGN